MKMLSTIVLLVGAAPALAQGSGSPSGDSKASDQNQIVCERYEETGSRLATRRVCKTVREWQEHRSAQRADTERAQQNVGIDRSN